MTDALGQRMTDAGPAGIELRLVASVSTATLRAALHTWLEADGDLATLIDDAFDRLSRGLEPSSHAPLGLPCSGLSAADLRLPFADEPARTALTA